MRLMIVWLVGFLCVSTLMADSAKEKAVQAALDKEKVKTAMLEREVADFRNGRIQCVVPKPTQQSIEAAKQKLVETTAQVAALAEATKRRREMDEARQGRNAALLNQINAQMVKGFSRETIFVTVGVCSVMLLTAIGFMIIIRLGTIRMNEQIADTRRILLKQDGRFSDIDQNEKTLITLLSTVSESFREFQR